MGRAMNQPLALWCVVLATGCGNGAKDTAHAAAASQVELSVEARKAAVVESASERFQRTVKAAFLDQGMTVRGLVRAVAKSNAKGPAWAQLHPSKYDSKAAESAKLEVVDGKVIYSAAANAVIEGGDGRWVVPYEVAAEVTPEGKLQEFAFHQLGAARRAALEAPSELVEPRREQN
jgi:hypothetical protein